MILLKRVILLFISLSSSIMFLTSMPDLNKEDIIICLPYTIEGTNIILESLYSNVHTGFTEAVFLNDSTELLESFYVELETSSGIYCFETTMLPAGARIRLRERDGKMWNDPVLLHSRGNYKLIADHIEMTSFKLCGSDLLICNEENSEKSFDIYLKPWDDEMQMYLSGKTQKIAIRNFLSNDVLSVKLPESNYKIVHCVCYYT